MREAGSCTAEEYYVVIIVQLSIFLVDFCDDITMNHGLEYKTRNSAVIVLSMPYSIPGT